MIMLPEKVNGAPAVAVEVIAGANTPIVPVTQPVVLGSVQVPSFGGAPATVRV